MIVPKISMPNKFSERFRLVLNSESPPPAALLSPVNQFIIFSAFAVAMAVAYLFVHHRFKERYKDSIQELSRLSTQSSYIALNPVDHNYTVFYQGSVYEPGMTLSQSSFGLERFSSYRSVLDYYRGIATAMNQVSELRRSGLMAAIRPADSRFYRMPLAYLGLVDREESLQLVKSDFDSLSSAGGESFLHRAESILRSADVFDPYALSVENAALVVSDDAVGKAVANAAEKAKKAANALVPGRIVARPKEVEGALDAYFTDWRGSVIAPALAAIDAPTGKREQVNGSKALSTDAHREAPSGSSDVSTPLSNRTKDTLPLLNKQFHQQVETVLDGELGSVWLIGRFRWLELIWWVWFGVLTKGLIDLGINMTGVKGEISEPREILRIAAKLIYAPLLALALFFTASLFGTEKEAFVLGQSSPVNLGIAFIFGMFPNTTFRILQDLATRLFREDLTSSSGAGRPMPASTRVTVIPSPQDRETPYHLSQLIHNAATHVTGPLQPII